VMAKVNSPLFAKHDLNQSAQMAIRPNLF
jgi:hypothetical protein